MHLLNSEFEDILYDISVEDNYRYTKFDNIEIINKEKASKILNSSPLSSHAEYECIFRPHPDTDSGNIRTAFRNYPDSITAYPDTLSND